MTETTEIARHREGCTAGDTDLRWWRGRQADWMATCRSCKRISQGPPVEAENFDPEIAKQKQPAVDAEKPKPKPKRAVRSRYVCRVHYEPVDHRGRGCGACAREDVERQEERRALKARRRASAGG